MVAESDTEDASIALAECENVAATFPAGNRTWTVPTRPIVGPLRTFESKCLDVNGEGNVGDLLKVSTCDSGSATQQWKFGDPPNWTLFLADKTNLCVSIPNFNDDITDGKLVSKFLIGVH